jgi:hypothetical protein
MFLYFWLIKLATYLQIEQEWIQLKGMLLLYQFQVVSNNVYIEVASAKP